MRYAIHYNKNFRYLNEVDEIVLDYKGIGDIVKFIPKKFKPEQKIIIRIAEVEDIKNVLPFLIKLTKVHSNFIVQIDLFSQKEYIELLKDNNIGFMFINFAKQFDQFYTMAELGAEDIYIVEDLAFFVGRLQDIRHKYNINLRLIPDIAQSAMGTSHVIPQITKFFIRPEDIDAYEDYIDVIEISRDNDRQSTIYEIYKQQQWSGNLEDIILDLDLQVNNLNIAPHFGPNRVNCGKRCMYGRCNLCMEMQELATRFKLVGIQVKKDRKRTEVPAEEKEKMFKLIKGKQNEPETN